jgi:predicted transcriptional regulator YdeE
VPEQTYVVFQRNGHVSKPKQTSRFAFVECVPKSEFELIDAPLFECDSDEFDSFAGHGGLELWIPERMAQ